MPDNRSNNFSSDGFSTDSISSGKGDDWTAGFFQGMALELWREAIPVERTRAEADFLAAALDVQPGALLLDVPSGNGRLALELARRGYSLTGVEQSPEFHAEGGRAAEREGLEIRWRCGDMRRLDDLALQGRFDGAFCFGNSFAYFGRAGTEAFLAGVGSALKPGGRFALDTGMAAESILPGLDDRSWTQVGEMRLLVERRYDPNHSRIESEYTFIRNGVSESRTAFYWVFTVAEIRRMLAAAGLATVELYGGLDHAAFEVGDSRLLLIAEKARQE